MPAPESYRTWKNHVRDEVKSCSDRPDEAWLWLNEVYDQECAREQLEKKLQEAEEASKSKHEKFVAAFAANDDAAASIKQLNDEKAALEKVSVVKWDLNGECS